MIAVNPLLAVVEMLRELYAPHVHRERYWVQKGQTAWSATNVVRVPPLLAQLEHAAPSSTGSDRSGGGYASRPAARLEALDTLVRIDIEAARWVRDLGEDDPGATVDCVQLLSGLAADADWCGRSKARRDAQSKVTCCARHQLEVDVRRWYAQARVATGWDTAPWRPDNTCPMCGVRGSLRIRLEDRAGFCAECRETWGPEDYQQLAAHIRAESAAARRAKRERACQCEWPRMVDPSTYGLCPRCGSSTCVNAVRTLGRRDRAS